MILIKQAYIKTGTTERAVFAWVVKSQDSLHSANSSQNNIYKSLEFWTLRSYHQYYLIYNRVNSKLSTTMTTFNGWSLPLYISVIIYLKIFL